MNLSDYITTLSLFHGTSRANGIKIMREGFQTGEKYNWEIKSKKNYVYLSWAYAPFFAMAVKPNPSEKLALIKIEIDMDDAYPDDDFLMLSLGKPRYTQADLDKVRLSDYKYLAINSFKYLGNVAVRPETANKGIKGVRYFNGRGLVMKVDPTITPINFSILGNWYHDLTEFIYEGGDFNDFESY